MSQYRFALMLPVGLLAIAACGGGGDATNPPPPPTVAAVSVTAPPALIKIDESTSLAATAMDANGTPLSGHTVAWTVDHSNIATVAGNGASATVTGVAQGVAKVTATVDGKSGTATINVSSDHLTFPSTGNVTVANDSFTPATVDLAAGGTVTWTWAQGAVTHNVTFTSGPITVSAISDRSTGSDSRTFSSPGTYDYHCTIHGTAMSGTIIVH